jgi:hypothetical protein
MLNIEKDFLYKGDYDSNTDPTYWVSKIYPVENKKNPIFVMNNRPYKFNDRPPQESC